MYVALCTGSLEKHLQSCTLGGAQRLCNNGPLCARRAAPCFFFSPSHSWCCGVEVMTEGEEADLALPSPRPSGCSSLGVSWVLFPLGPLCLSQLVLMFHSFFNYCHSVLPALSSPFYFLSGGSNLLPGGPSSRQVAKPSGGGRQMRVVALTAMLTVQLSSLQYGSFEKELDDGSDDSCDSAKIHGTRFLARAKSQTHALVKHSSSNLSKVNICPICSVQAHTHTWLSESGSR